MLLVRLVLRVNSGARSAPAPFAGDAGRGASARRRAASFSCSRIAPLRSATVDFSRPHSALLSPSSLASRDVSFSFAANCRRSDAEAAEAEATSDAPSPTPSPPTSSLASRRANASAALACPRSAAFAYSRRASRASFRTPTPDSWSAPRLCIASASPRSAAARKRRAASSCSPTAACTYPRLLCACACPLSAARTYSALASSRSAARPGTVPSSCIIANAFRPSADPRSAAAENQRNAPAVSATPSGSDAPDRNSAPNAHCASASPAAAAFSYHFAAPAGSGAATPNPSSSARARDCAPPPRTPTPRRGGTARRPPTHPRARLASGRPPLFARRGG